MKWFVQLICSLLVAIGIAYFFALKLDPELQHYAAHYKVKASLAREMSTPKVVFIGGSSCTHSVRPSDFYVKGIPCSNMGYHAGAGAPMIIAGGLSIVKAGDLVVLAMEPSLLVEDFKVSREGLVGALKLKNASLANGGRFTPEKLSIGDYFFPIRPGGGRLAKYTASLLPCFDLDQYLMVDEYGWFSDSRRIAAPASMAVTYTGLTAMNRSMIGALIDYCEDSGITLVCAIPWKLCKISEKKQAQEWHNQYRMEMAELMPVLEESDPVCVFNKQLFSDTANHLTAKGAMLRTQAYLQALERGQFLYKGHCEHLDLLCAFLK